MKNSIKLMVSLASTQVVSAAVLFDHNFQNGTAGAIASTGDLGNPAVGTISANGGFVSSTRPAFTSGNNDTANSLTVPADGTFNDVGTPSGSILTATLSGPAAITGELLAGESTTVAFTLGLFGDNNREKFKYTHIIGTSSQGAEVFHLTFLNGSISTNRELYAREFGENTTTFTGGVNTNISGTKVVDDIQQNLESRDTAVRPGTMLQIAVAIDDSGWGVTAQPSGGNSTSTPVSNLGIASGATDLTTLTFFTSFNGDANAMNVNGIWVDNILVESDRISVIPEPASLSLLGLSLLAMVGFRRRS